MSCVLYSREKYLGNNNMFTLMYTDIIMLTIQGCLHLSTVGPTLLHHLIGPTSLGTTSLGTTSLGTTSLSTTSLGTTSEDTRPAIRTMGKPRHSPVPSITASYCYYTVNFPRIATHCGDRVTVLH